MSDMFDHELDAYDRAYGCDGPWLDDIYSHNYKPKSYNRPFRKLSAEQVFSNYRVPDEPKQCPDKLE